MKRIAFASAALLTRVFLPALKNGFVNWDNGKMPCSMRDIREKRSGRVAAFACGLAAFLIYLPALGNDFVTWDDDIYVYKNFFVFSLDAALLKHAFLTAHGGSWYPLTLISHALDYSVWGLNPFGHHLTSIVLHGLNAVLVILLTLRLAEAGAAKPRTALSIGIVSGLLFGLHPVHVESVAWISERKDVLCAFFSLLSILAYVRYASFRSDKSTPAFSDRSYMASLAFFLASLMSKPMAVTLPAVLMVMDWYPLARTARGHMKNLLIEKAPFVAAGMIVSAVTVFTQGADNAVLTLSELPLTPRIVVSVKGLIGYLGKLLYPAVLLPLYPYPKVTSLLSGDFLFALAALATITAVCVLASGKLRLAAAVWACYVITLMPVIGIIQVGEQSMADRYTYLPGIGPGILVSVLAVWAYERWMARLDVLKYAFITAGFGLMLLLTLRTEGQIKVWRNGGTLWTHEINKEPEYAVGYTNRGDYFTQIGRYEDAVRDLDIAVSLTPGSSDPYYYRGVVYLRMGKYMNAYRDLTVAISLSGYEDYRYYRNRAETLAKLGYYKEAEQDYSASVRLNPKLPELYADRGGLYAALGRYAEALEDFTKAITLCNDTNAGYYRDRANALVRLGRTAEASADLRRADEIGRAYPRRM